MHTHTHIHVHTHSLEKQHQKTTSTDCDTGRADNVERQKTGNEELKCVLKSYADCWRRFICLGEFFLDERDRKKIAALPHTGALWLLLETLDGRTINYIFNTSSCPRVSKKERRREQRESVCVCVRTCVHVCVRAVLIAVPHLLINFLA